MKKEEEKRDFSMSFAELEQFVRNVISSMRRDSAEFDNYGVSAGDIDDFEDLCNDFEDLPTDAELEGIVTIKTQAKDAKADELQVETREITTRVEVKFGENSGEYRSLDAGDLTRFSDPSLLRCARRVHRRGTDMLADLASEGLTQQILDDYDVLIQGFEDALDDKDDAVKDRDIATNNRVQKANELYEFLSNYCNYGKRIWINTNEAKYNDYVIYKTEGDLPGKVLNLGYDSGTGIVSWDVPQSPEPIDKYELERSTDGENWTVVYEGAENQALVPLLSGANYFRCRAHNKNGWGSWSDTLEVTIGGIPYPEWVKAEYSGVPPGAKVTPEQVEVTWANVAAATMYEVWRSVVNVGDPAGDFSMIGEEASEMYLDFDLKKNKRNYYYIIAKNETDRSEPSDVAFDDIVDDV